MKVIFLLIVFAFLIFSCSDLRTSLVKKEANENKARELLSEMLIAHHTEKWDSVQTYSVFFQDRFYGRIGKMASPYPDDVLKMRFDYLPGDFNGRLTFTDGEWQGKQWGFFSNQTYENLNESDTLQYSKNKDAQFWVPTYQYFIEFPARITEADAMGYAGQKQIGKHECEGIMASWGTLEPQRKIDQYLIWLDTETHRIVKISYTIREVNSMVKGAVYFEDYQDFNGLLIPTRMPVESNLVRDGMLHEMRIDSIHFNEKSIESIKPKTQLVELTE